MLRLLIARHGNTFDKGDIIRRVGLRTDLDLSKSGQEQCLKLARYLSDNYKTIDKFFCSELKRTQQTAKIILDKTNFKSLPAIEITKELNEIDYGIDDGKAESEVIKRVGIDALNAWDEFASPPSGWLFNKKECLTGLINLTNKIVKQYNDKTVLLVTSNGVARFFPELLDDLEGFNKKYKLKMPTTSISEFIFDNNCWLCKSWAVKP